MLTREEVKNKMASILSADGESTTRLGTSFSWLLDSAGLVAKNKTWDLSSNPTVMRAHLENRLHGEVVENVMLPEVVRDLGESKVAGMQKMMQAALVDELVINAIFEGKLRKEGLTMESDLPVLEKAFPGRLGLNEVINADDIMDASGLIKALNDVFEKDVKEARMGCLDTEGIPHVIMSLSFTFPDESTKTVSHTVSFYMHDEPARSRFAAIVKDFVTLLSQQHIKVYSYGGDEEDIYGTKEFQAKTSSHDQLEGLVSLFNKTIPPSSDLKYQKNKSIRQNWIEYEKKHKVFIPDKMRDSSSDMAKYFSSQKIARQMVETCEADTLAMIKVLSSRGSS